VRKKALEKKIKKDSQLAAKINKSWGEIFLTRRRTNTQAQGGRTACAGSPPSIIKKGTFCYAPEKSYMNF
jgi:hypothetical protein